MVDIGSPERLSVDELHAKVWPAAAEVLDGPRRALLERISGAGERLVCPTAVLAACREGRVAALLVQPGRLRWGRLDEDDGHAERGPGDVELVSAVIAAALDQGAELYAAAPGELPGDAPVAALLRY